MNLNNIKIRAKMGGKGHSGWCLIIKVEKGGILFGDADPDLLGATVYKQIINGVAVAGAATPFCRRKRHAAVLAPGYSIIHFANSPESATLPSPTQKQESIPFNVIEFGLADLIKRRCGNFRIARFHGIYLKGYFVL